MGREHRARINWSPEQARLGLPITDRIVDPAWLPGAVPKTDEGWSLICQFDSPPSEQGNPSTARVHFLVDEAPHDRLQPGATLRLFERATRGFAAVEIVD